MLKHGLEQRFGLRCRSHRFANHTNALKKGFSKQDQLIRCEASQAKGSVRKEKAPWQQTILNTILQTTQVPYSSYVPEPQTYLHKVDARIKQLWLMSLFLLTARGGQAAKLVIVLVVLLVTVLFIPRRLLKAQLSRILILCGLAFVFTAFGTDSIPPLETSRTPTPELQNLPSIPQQVTRRSFNLAITTVCLTLVLLQGASLGLTTTPPESLAKAFGFWIKPLSIIRVPVNAILFSLLLSLRFVSVVFEEIRNLFLGVAARGINWKAQGGIGTFEIFLSCFVQLFRKLFQRCDAISQSILVRGFSGPNVHKVYLAEVVESSRVANVVALCLLVGLYACVILL